MKKILFILLFPAFAFAQSPTSTSTQFGNALIDIRPIYQKVNYSTSAVIETTAWFAIEPYREVAIVMQATDSARLAVITDGRNGTVINMNKGATISTDSLLLADSVVGGPNVGEVKNILYKSATLNTLLQPGNNQVRFRISYQGANIGTTNGRIFRIWLVRVN